MRNANILEFLQRQGAKWRYIKTFKYEMFDSCWDVKRRERPL
jgi:hypothetical protein